MIDGNGPDEGALTYSVCFVRAMLNSSTLNGLMSKSPLHSRLVLNPA